MLDHKARERAGIITPTMIGPIPVILQLDSSFEVIISWENCNLPRSIHVLLNIESKHNSGKVSWPPHFFPFLFSFYFYVAWQASFSSVLGYENSATKYPKKHLKLFPRYLQKKCHQDMLYVQVFSQFISTNS